MNKFNKEKRKKDQTVSSLKENWKGFQNLLKVQMGLRKMIKSQKRNSDFHMRFDDGDSQSRDAMTSLFAGMSYGTVNKWFLQLTLLAN